MKYKEEKIASFQLEKQRWQLLKITNELNLENYQIRKNRKVLTNCKWIGTAKQRFATIISNELNQLNLFN